MTRDNEHALDQADLAFILDELPQSSNRARSLVQRAMRLQQPVWRTGNVPSVAAQAVSGADGLLENFDFTAHLQRQREWSERTFGPGSRAAGVVDHIRKELKEIEADPGDLREWVDVVILALDGAWRSGAKPDQIIDAIVAKQTKNEGRSWPDWRTVDPNKAIEHDRSGEVQPSGNAGELHASFEEWRKREYPWTSAATDGMGFAWDAYQAGVALAAQSQPPVSQPVVDLIRIDTILLNGMPDSEHITHDECRRRLAELGDSRRRWLEVQQLVLTAPKEQK